MGRLFTLFFSSFKLSMFTFGGGYVIVPLLKERFVDDLAWIEEKEMMDLFAIAQSAPGSLAVNATILIGYKVNGFVGTLVATLGTVLPPLILLSIISYYYTVFSNNIYINAALVAMSASVAAIVLDVVVKMFLTTYKEEGKKTIYIISVVFIAGFFLKINILFIILAVILYAVIKHFWESL